MRLQAENLLDLALQCAGIGSDNFGNLFTVLEDLKGRHGADSALSRNILNHTRAHQHGRSQLGAYRQLVNVNLQEDGVRVLF